MKNKFKKDFIKAFNEKYNYENESLIKTVEPKKPIFTRRILSYLSIIIITMLISVSVTCVIMNKVNNYRSNDFLYEKIENYCDEKYDSININFTSNFLISDIDEISLYNLIVENKIKLFVGIRSYNSNDSVKITINGTSNVYNLEESVDFIELTLEKDVEYSLDIEYIVDNQVKLKFVENLKF